MFKLMEDHRYQDQIVLEEVENRDCFASNVRYCDQKKFGEERGERKLVDEERVYVESFPRPSMESREN